MDRSNGLEILWNGKFSQIKFWSQDARRRKSFLFFLLFSCGFITQHFLFYWMIMKIGMIVDDAEEFPCGDGLRDRAVIHAYYHNYP